VECISPHWLPVLWVNGQFRAAILSQRSLWPESAAPSTGPLGNLQMKNLCGSKKRYWTVVCGLVLACGAGMCVAQETSRKVIKRVEAQYPAILKQRGIGGVVKLRVLILANGTVKDTQVMGGNAILADRAQKAVKQWVFAPAAADSTMEVSIVFDPNSQTE
jgi:TonB family protein